MTTLELKTLIGKEIQKPEGTKMYKVVSVAEGWLKNLFQVTYEDGTSSQFDYKSFTSLLETGFAA